jgi:hypothetical protein
MCPACFSEMAMVAIGAASSAGVVAIALRKVSYPSLCDESQVPDQQPEGEEENAN